MNFATLFSGIEAPAVAWENSGWTQLFRAEIESFCNAVTDLRFPGIKNYGDILMVKDGEWEKYRGTVDIIIAGTPCQSFSLAGKRRGMDDERGNMAIEYIRIAGIIRPRWIIFENVPGILSSKGGRDFGIIINKLAEFGYGWAYRVLDAQHFGVPQRRRRVFFVGHSSGDWRGPFAVLFERENLCENSSTGGKAGQEVARTITASTGGASGKEQQYTFIRRINGKPLNALQVQWASGGGNVLNDTAKSNSRFGDISPHVLTWPDKAMPLMSRDYKGPGNYRDGGLQGCVAHTLRREGFDASGDGTGRGTPIVPDGYSIRRLTPVECERLMGLPDNFTLIPWRKKAAEDCPDGPRYRCIGNSMAVPVVRWIGERIKMLEELKKP